MNRYLYTYSTCIIAVFTLFLVIFIAIGKFGFAYADEDMSLDEALTQLENVQAEYDNDVQSIEELKADLNAKEDEALAAQEVKNQCMQNVNKIAATSYKTGFAAPYLTFVVSSGSIHEFLQNIHYCNQIMKKNIEIVREKNDAVNNFERSITDLNASIDEIRNRVRISNEKVASMQAIVDKINAKKQEEKDSAVIEIETPKVPDPQPVAGDWKSGYASAYGGHDDPNPGGITATGSAITEMSTGVSFSQHMPNYKSYFGRTVQVRHNGKTVIATVNDCGSFAYPARCMDLQPGIYHSFGYSGCLDWGVRQIDYLIF